MDHSDIVIKINGGTQRGDIDLCRSCSRAFIAKGDSKEVRKCQHSDRVVPFEVRTCTDYYQRGLTDISDLYRTAWILETSPSRGLGFLPWNKWHEKHKGEVPY